VSVPLLLINLIARDAFGGGDIKLMAAAGFLLGWQGALLATCIGMLVGGAYAAWLIAIKKKGRKEHFPFGPALCMGIATALFFGTTLMDWCFLGP
jgi:leader peptidase (prepilin peptidase)/N-methyltransferase